MNTLDLDSQKVTEDIYFYDFGDFGSGIPIIYHTNRRFYEGQSRLVSVDTTRLNQMFSDAAQEREWISGIREGIRTIVPICLLLWALIWGASKLLQAL
jgi:hypothetical protein